MIVKISSGIFETVLVLTESVLVFIGVSDFGFRIFEAEGYRSCTNDLMTAEYLRMMTMTVSESSRFGGKTEVTRRE